MPQVVWSTPSHLPPQLRQGSFFISLRMQKSIKSDHRFRIHPSHIVSDPYFSKAQDTELPSARFRKAWGKKDFLETIMVSTLSSVLTQMLWTSRICWYSYYLWLSTHLFNQGTTWYLSILLDFWCFRFFYVCLWCLVCPNSMSQQVTTTTSLLRFH